jgi:hypothetical protein
MSLFTTHLTVNGATFHVDYESIDQALGDMSLAQLLDNGAEVVLWAGSLRLTGTPIRSSRELRKTLVENAKTILRRTL